MRLKLLQAKCIRYLVRQDTVSPGGLGSLWHGLPGLLVGVALELDDLHVGVGLISVSGNGRVGSVGLHNFELVIKVTISQILNISVWK